MRTALLFASLLLSGLTARAQSQPAPFKDANMIIIQTADSSTVALRKMGQILVSQGYTIDKLDSTFGTLLTTAKPLQSLVTPIALTIRASATEGANSRIVLRGDFTFSVMGNATVGRAQYSSAKKGGNRVAFDELDRAAASYSGGRKGYSKE